METDDTKNIKKEDSSALPPKNRTVNNPASPLRTFSTDLAQAVRKDEMSVIKVAMAEDKRRHEVENEESPKSPKNRAYVIFGIIFIILAVGGIAAAFIVKKSRTPDIISGEVSTPSIIKAEATTSIEVGGAEAGKIVDLTRTALKNVSAKDGEVVNIYYTDSTAGIKRTIVTGEFMGGIKSAIPAPLLRSLANAFMLGIYTKATARHPFLIFKTNDHSIAFANMFIWEKKLFSDLYLPFNFPADESSFTGKFTDLLVENKDTRVLQKDDGTILLIYGFADENTIIITDSIESFKEILRRLQSVR